MSGVGNALYLFLGSFSRSLAPYAIIISRFLSGAGSGMFLHSHQSISLPPSGNRGCFRALVACNSQGVDRARALASSGGAALVGLTIGPAVQLVFNFMGADGVAIGPLVLSQYTAPALLAIVINAATLVFRRISLLYFRFRFSIPGYVAHSFTSTLFPIQQISDTFRPTWCVDCPNLPIAVPSTSTTSSMIPSIFPRSPIPSHPQTSFSRMTVKVYVTFPSFCYLQSLKSSHIHIVNHPIILQEDTPRVPSLPLRMDVIAVIICMGTRSIRMLATSNIERSLYYSFFHSDNIALASWAPSYSMSLQHRRSLHWDHVQLHTCSSSRVEFIRSNHRWSPYYRRIPPLRIHQLHQVVGYRILLRSYTTNQ